MKAAPDGSGRAILTKKGNMGHVLEHLIGGQLPAGLHHEVLAIGPANAFALFECWRVRKDVM